MKKRVIALGFFDGIHLGHKALIDKANEIAKLNNATSTVFTFNRHPSEVISNKKIPFLVDELKREQQILSIGGCDEVIFWDFNHETSTIAWDDFIKNVLLKYNPCHIVTGIDFRFGKKGLGDSEKLANLCKDLNIGYSAINQVTAFDKRVSSTEIRSLIAKGDIKTANTLLGHNFSVTGIVSHGRKQGRIIGFRTANFDFPTSLQTPPFGVYATLVSIDGKTFNAITNIGVVPSFCDTEKVIVETHILDFSDEIYDKEITVFFLDFIRYEQKFNGIDEIKLQIEKDVKLRLSI